jgi:uncharacterized protein
MSAQTLRFRRRPEWFCSCAVALATVAAAFSQLAEVPYLTGRITDNAEILSYEGRARITELLRAHEAGNTDQVAVLTMRSLEGAQLEEFAARVSESWKLGEAGKNNGVLLIVSPGDHRARVDVGAGLAGKLDEMSAARIVRDLMAPRFEQGDFDAGVEAGVRAVISALEGDDQPGTVPSESGKASSDSIFEGPDLTLQERVLIGAFIFGIIGLFTIIGLLTPGAGWFLYLFLIPFWAMFPIIVLGINGAFVTFIAYIIGFPVVKLAIRHTELFQKVAANFKSKGGGQIGGFAMRSGSGSSHTWSSR